MGKVNLLRKFPPSAAADQYVSLVFDAWRIERHNNADTKSNSSSSIDSPTCQFNMHKLHYVIELSCMFPPGGRRLFSAVIQNSGMRLRKGIL